MTTKLSRVSSPAPATNSRATWVQTERAIHEAWGRLALNSPRAAALAHFLVANMESTGAVIASWSTLARTVGMSVATVRRAADDLRSDRWIEIVQVGGKGTVNAFVINSRVAWAQGRDKLHTASFTARVIASSDEQSRIDDVPLRRFPVLLPGELQLPMGEGEAPPSQPSLDGLEPEVPAINLEAIDPSTGEILKVLRNLKIEV